MNEPRVFVITLLALRVDLEGTQLNGAAGASTILTVQTSAEEAESTGWKTVYERYPQSEEWFSHQVTIHELPNSLETDGYTISLSISKVGGEA